MDSNKVVVISKKVKRIGLHRFLVSKIVYEPEKVVMPDLVALFQNQLWMQDKALTDRQFQRKFEKSLEEISTILKRLNLSRGFAPTAVRKLGKTFQQSLPDFLFPIRNFPAMKAKFSGTYSPKSFRPLGVETKRLPPKQFIGKGYGDKGTAKKPHLDGSPSWQDVASAVSNKERRIDEIKEELQGATSIEEIFKIFDKNIKK